MVKTPDFVTQGVWQRGTRHGIVEGPLAAPGIQEHEFFEEFVMTIEFGCTCGKKFQVKDELAGKQTKCPTCGHKLVIPDPAESEGLELADEEEEDLYGVSADEAKRSSDDAFPDALVGLTSERCPSCDELLEAGAVLCVKCGLNLKTGKRMVSETDGGSEEEEYEEAKDKEPVAKKAEEKQTVVKEAKKAKIPSLSELPKGARIGIAAGAVVVMLIVVWFFVFSGDGKRKRPAKAPPRRPPAQRRAAPAPPTQPDEPAPRGQPSKEAPAEKGPGQEIPKEQAPDEIPPAKPVKEPEIDALFDDKPVEEKEPRQPKLEIKEEPEPVDSASLPGQVTILRQKYLNLRPRTPENLLTLANWCQKKGLLLEAEECLRAASLVEPLSEPARQLYDRLGAKVQNLLGTVSACYPFAVASEELSLGDSLSKAAPGQQFVTLPVDVHLSEGQLHLDGESLTATAGEGPAILLGFRGSAPSTKSKAAAGGNAAEGNDRRPLWEKLSVRAEEDGSMLVALQNQVVPMPDEKSKTLYRMKLQKTVSKQPYAGPYEVVFSVPTGKPLTEIRYGKEAPIRLFSEDPGSLKDFILDESNDPADRIAAVKSLAANPSAGTLEILSAAISGGGPEILAAARGAMRIARRRLDVVDGAYCPVSEDQHQYLLLLWRSRGQAKDAGDAGSGESAREETAPVLKAIWDIDKPGRYFSRLMSFGDGPDYRRTVARQMVFEVSKPGLYLCELAAGSRQQAAGSGHAPELAELWRERKLLERTIVADDKLSQARVGIKTSVARPPQAGSSTTVEAVALLDAPDGDLSPLQRAARSFFKENREPGEGDKMRPLLVAVSRLEIPGPAADAPAVDAAVERINRLLGERTAGLLGKLVEDAPRSVNLLVVRKLGCMALQSPQACGALIALQDVIDADVKKTARSVVEELMAIDVIAREGTSWLYHGQRHGG